MNKIKKWILYTVAGIAIAGILLLSIRYISNNQYRAQLPPLTDIQNINPALEEQMTNAWKAADKNPSSRNLGRLGMVYHSSAIYDKAAVCYKLAIRKNNSKWIWLYYLGYLDKEMGDNPGVVENFKKVTRKKPDNSLAWYYLGEGYQSMGSYDKAAEVFDRISAGAAKKNLSSGSSRSDHYPLSVYATFQQASIYINSGKLEEAEKDLRQIIKEQPEFGQAYRLLGNIYSMQGNDTLSKKFLTRAGDLRIYTPPVDTLIDILAGISCSDIYLLKQVDDADKGGYPNFALELVRTGLLNMPDNKFVISKAIKLFLARGLDRMALPYMETHLKDFSDDQNELRMVADLCMKRGLYSQALRYYDQGLKLVPDNKDLQLARIMCLGNSDRKDEARSALTSLIKNNPGNVQLLTSSVYIMILSGEKDEALRYLTKLQQTAPHNGKVLQLSGMALELDGKEEKALEMYEASFKADPEDLSTSRYLGDLLIKLKIWERALSQYRKSLEYFPNDPYILERLGTLLVMCPETRLRNIEEGREYSERAFINKSSPPLTVISAGRCISESYAATGDNASACSYLSRTIDMARQEKVPNEMITDLEKDLQKYKQEVK